MPYPNEHAARLKNPGKYDSFRRQNDKFGKGVHAIWGIVDKKTELQSIRFDAKKFTVKEAKKWLKDHDYKPILFEPASGKEARAVSFRGAVTGSMRNATFEGREHLVVPVVALIEGVIHPVNTETPELVLAEEFAKVPDGWNGEPVLWDHPVLSGRRVPANEPLVLERMAFGQLFHTKVKDDKLATEAWLDLDKAKQLEDAQRVLERLRAGEMVEVSVGAFVETEDRSGEHRGKRYQGVWRHIVPDHLAFLPEEKVGACSVEMGCGAPRAAKGGDVRKHEEEFAAACAAFAQDGQSDQELRDALDSALRATEPGYYGIVAVFPDDSLVVYGVAPEETFILYRRGFKIKTDSSVSLADKKEEVHAVTRFEPVTASATCGGCGQALSGGLSTTAPAKEKDMVTSKEKKDRVAAIIATEKTCFKAEDAPILEQLSDERLTAMEQFTEKVKAAEANVKKKKEDEAKAADVKKKEDEAKAAAAKAKTPEQEETEFLATHPALSKIVTDAKAAETAKKDELVASLKDAAKAGYTEDQLKAMDVPQLVQLAATLLKPKPNFSGAGVPRDEGSDEEVPAPPDMGARVLAMREKKPA